MELGLKNKVAIVTGAGSQIGFGKGIVQALAREGCHIVAADMDLEGAKKTAAEAEKLGVKAIAVSVNITQKAKSRKWSKTAIAKLGKIDILVNNAGASTSPKPFTEKTEAEIDKDINVNLRGCINCCKAVLGHMLSRKSGKIVNIRLAGRKPAGPVSASTVLPKPVSWSSPSPWRSRSLDRGLTSTPSRPVWADRFYRRRSA